MDFIRKNLASLTKSQLIEMLVRQYAMIDMELYHFQIHENSDYLMERILSVQKDYVAFYDDNSIHKTSDLKEQDHTYFESVFVYDPRDGEAKVLWFVRFCDENPRSCIFTDSEYEARQCLSFRKLLESTKEKSS